MRTWLISCALVLSACPPPTPTEDGGVERDAGEVVDAGGSFVVTRLDAGVLDGGAPVRYELLKLQVGTHAAAYAQWMPAVSADGGLAPVLLLTRPYDGIAWTGEDVDARWFSKGTGLFPDVDSPDAPANPGVISYVPITPQREVDDTFIWRLHAVSVLSVYGRFYAGGSIQNDVDDMVAGLEFLAREPGVDTSRIGIFGGSWGGFEAVYGAAYAPENATPKVGVALYPLTDFASEVDFVTRVMPGRYTLPASISANEAFFAPYLRRIEATTGGLPDAGGDYSRFDVDAVASRLRTPFLFVHDSYDTLVDVAQTERLVAAQPTLISPLYLRHAAPPNWDMELTNHGSAVAMYGGGAVPFVVARLLRALHDGPVIYVPFDGSFLQLLTFARDQQRAGASYAELAARLRELLDPRVVLVNVVDGAQYPGPEGVALAVNLVWGTTFTAATIDAALASGLPP